MILHTIETGLFKLDGGAMFGVVPKSIWQKSNPADENNLCTWAMRCLLVEEGNRLILVDTGIGNKLGEKMLSHLFLHGDDTLEKSLAAKGFSTDDITDVFLTHLHFDHVGGAVVRQGDQLLPAFKNAAYWSNEKHWDWAVHPNVREKPSFLTENIIPIRESGQLRFIDTRQQIEFLPDFNVRFAFGHTDAMMLPQLKYKGRTIIYAADLLPSTGHIPLPYVMSYDMFPMQTLTEKKEILEEAAANEYIFYLEHDPLNECCTVEQTEKGIKLKNIFKLSDL
ncbi:Glyoxylase, beta-lactamase superfamily II [Pedobacter westerhofensis]|uniref:Glyoxylase, beta-lactamase superfamily II n=1 Tax=Pedobacter westerhofensis TaxID=425512 RepID=A0A521EA06_9SPHI|nr:MBL fold metallo-hydrolase [Pedobacter westerhofensis]SMO80281.1 Glyoxylase, beta-lactamase superfamily II [Pedobacter westerhofensis]